MKRLISLAIVFCLMGAAQSNAGTISAFPITTALLSTGGMVGIHPYIAVTAATTTYFNIFATNTNAHNNSDEDRVLGISPVACTMKNMYVTTRGTTSAAGAVTVKLRKAKADTTLVVTIPANTSTTPSSFSDTTHTVSIAAGDVLSLSIGNADNAANMTVVGVTMLCQ
jgi:hypothetical protein